MSRWLSGIFDPSGRADSARVDRALEPEEARTLESGPLRLSYSGPPPRTNPICLLDGFLDDAEAIREELELAGEPSMEELLAAGYRRWGRALLGRLRGDFALLIWDPERQQGLLARDQLGVRPLYLSDAGDGVRFAGEVRHLIAQLPRRPDPDRASVAHWIATSSRPGTQTLYAGIRRLEPGGVLWLDRSGARQDSYWAPRFSGPVALPPAELTAAVRGGLERAVGRRIAAGAPTGVLMSGGLDSSAVAALCAELTAGEEDVLACSATFPDHPAADESELIAELRRALGLSAVSVEIRAGGLVASALEHLDAWQMPLLGWGDFWTLPLMRLAAAEGATTMLDGDGGDELFGPRTYLLADRLRVGHPFDVLRLALDLPGGGRHVPRRELAAVLRSQALIGALPYRFHRWGRKTLTRREAPEWLGARAVGDLAASDDPFAWKRLDGPRWWASAAHGVTRAIEESGVFEHQRRRAALAGLEARHPLLDLDLVELGLAQPPRATFDRRFNRPVLRASMAGSLPDAVRLRPAKARFETLIADCLSGPDGAAVRQILCDPELELAAYLDPGAMRRDLFDSDRQRLANPFHWMWQVWRLLTAELWLRSQVSSTTFLRLDRNGGSSKLAS